jgi:hypothetical protein
MLRRYPVTLRWRQALPPLFVFSLAILALLSVFMSLARVLLVVQLLLYFSVLILAGLYSAYRQRRASLALGLPLAIPAMHLAWGSGFLWSLATTGFQKNG